LVMGILGEVVVNTGDFRPGRLIAGKCGILVSKFEEP